MIISNMLIMLFIFLVGYISNLVVNGAVTPLKGLRKYSSPNVTYVIEDYSSSSAQPLAHSTARFQPR